MKNNSTKFFARVAMVAILMITFFSGTAYSATYSLTPNAASTGSSATSYITTLTEFTYGGVSWKMNQWNPSTLQIKTNQASATAQFRFYNTSAIPGRITQVVITFSSMNVTDASKLMFLGGSSEVEATSGGTAGTWNSSDKTLTWTPSSSDNFTYFAFYQSGKAANQTNNLAASDAIVVTYTPSETPTCATPTFSPAAGSYNSTQNVTISSETVGASIYYTTDGSTPTTSSNLYASAISVSTTTTIKAIATKDGMNNSATASATYTIKAPYSGDGYIRVNSLSYLTDAAKVIFAARYNETASAYYAMTASTSGKPAGVSFTSTSTAKGEALPSSILDSEESYYWTVAVTANGYTFTNSSGDVLGYTSSTNFATNGDNTEWVVSLETSGNAAMVADYNGFYFINKNNTGRGIALNDSHNFGPYATSNNNNSSYNFYLDIFVEGASPASDPSISADDVNIAYGATAGSISYTIDNVPSPAGTLTASRISGDWLTVGVVGGSTVSLSCSANSGKERTASVRLTYTYGSEQTVTKDVTITQAANPEALDLISEITSAGTYRVQGTIVAMNSRGFIVGDGTGYVYYYYGNGFNPGSYSVGSMVNLYGSVVVYGGVFEFNNTTTINAAATSNYSSEEPTVLTGTEMDTRVGSNTAQLSTYVQYQGILSVEDTHYNITSIGGASTAVGSIAYPSNTDFTTLDGSLVTVKGYYVGVSSSKYYNTMIGSVEAVAVPTVAVSSSAINVDASGTSGTLTVNYENFSFDTANVVFYASDGITPASYDWVTASINGENNVAYTISGNPGSARYAYFKVRALDNSSNDYYSSLVTVSQSAASYSYATLPFEFTGGKSSIASTDGLSHEGLDSDYGDASAKLKFNDAGDYVILHFNEIPGTLTYCIKNNSFSGGTFTVQASANGVDYTDIVSYTDISGTMNESIDNLDASVRFIKWIYTEKVNGNVGLGSITLSKPASAQSTIVVNTTENDGNYWATFYCGEARYVLPEGAKAFTINSSKQLYLLGSDGLVIPANTAVIIMASTSTVTLTKSNDATEITINGGGNILLGSDSPVSKYGISGTPYVLGIVAGELGLYKFTGSGIPAGKAYYVVTE